MSELKQRMLAANVAPMYFKMKLPDFGKVGADLRDFVEDYENTTKGAYVFGAAKTRTYVLPVLAKELVLSSETSDVRLFTLRQIANLIERSNSPNIIDTENDYRIRVADTCITGFFNEQDCPLDRALRSHVEDFIQARIESGARFHLSASDPLDKATWWSSDLRNLLADHTTAFNIGR